MNEKDGGNAIFVRGLSINATSDQLEKFFAGVGPIRRSFVVTDKKSSRCTGLGFVYFALREDAGKALQMFQGASMGGRRLKLDFARPRQRGVEDHNDDSLLAKQRKPNFIPPERKSRGNLSGSESSRTVVVRTRLPGTQLESTALMDKLGQDPKKLGFLSSVLSADGHSMRLLFRSWPEAGAAAALLHCDEFEACVDSLIGGRKCRLIVRNIPFKIHPNELWSVFRQVAEVRDVSVPQSSKSSNVERHISTLPDSEKGVIDSRGFAFVEYFLAADANRAIQVINGRKIGGRTIAVDLAIGKSKFIEKRSFEESNGPSSIDGGLNDSVASDVNNDGDNRITDSLPEPSEKQPVSTPEEMMRTVFVRNLLFETTCAELRTAMITNFGPVEQVVIVKDPMTGRSRGTAFVRFEKIQSAESAITPVPNTSNAQRKTARNQSTFTLQGRDLLITRAVHRERARNMVTGSNERVVKVDRRNMRLAWVGHIKPDSPEARYITQADMAKRAKAAKEKRAKLSSNPNTFVSDTRLCVRNLPKSVDEKFLKHMALAIFRSLANQPADESSQLICSRPKVSHSKIVRDPDKKDRSRGYGFLQFEEHRHALQALHQLNNNPKLLETILELRPRALEIDDMKSKLLRQDWGSNRRLIVEFSVEDSRQVAIINRIKEKGKNIKEANKGEEKEKRKLSQNSKNLRNSKSSAVLSSSSPETINSGDRHKRRIDTLNSSTGVEGIAERCRRKKKKVDVFNNLVLDYKKRLVNK